MSASWAFLVLAGVVVLGSLLVPGGQAAAQQSGRVTDLVVTTTGPDSATATATVSAAGTYHLRFALQGAGSWREVQADAASAAGDLTFTLEGLAPNAVYDVEASHHSNFAVNVEAATFRNRPRHLDFNTPNATSHGLAANADVFWVGNNAGRGASLQAYRRTPESSYGQRISDKDIEIRPSGNSHPRGIWTDGTTLFVVDERDKKVYAYTIATESADADKGFDLASGHRDAWAIWANDELFWVATNHDGANSTDSLLAYSRVAANYGERVQSRDIVLRDNAQPRGLWSDGFDIWVADDSAGSPDHALAYNLLTGARRPQLDITLLGANGRPSALWGDGDLLWVVEDGLFLNMRKVYAYYLPVRPPVVSAITMVGTSPTTATVTAHTARVNMEGATVYMRYRGALDDDWSAAVSMPAAATVDFSLTGLTPNVWLEVQASLDSAFADGGELTNVLVSRRQDRDIHHLTQPGAPRGLWTDGTTLWVVSAVGARGRVEAYDLADGAYDTTRSFALAEANRNARGVYANATTMWVVDRNDTVYAYTITAGNSFGTADSAKTFELDEGRQPTGVWANDTRMWIADHVREQVRTYNVGPSGTFGAHDGTSEFTLAPAFALPRGLWSDGTTLWVADARFDRIFAYPLGGAERRLSREVRLANSNPWGIASSDGILWVADPTDDIAYAYFLPAAPTGSIESVTPGSPGRSSADITVAISNATSAEQTVTLDYATEAGSKVTKTAVTSTTSVEFELESLAADTNYEVAVSLGSTENLSTAGFKTLSEDEHRGRFLRLSVIEPEEGDHAWLGALYHGMRKYGVTPLDLPDQGDHLGEVAWWCSSRNLNIPHALGLHGCHIVSFRVGAPTEESVDTYIHELGHVFTIGTRYLGHNVEAVGMGWLYFQQLAARGTDCLVHELYPDALLKVVDPDAPLVYFHLCSNTEDTPTATTMAVAGSVLANEVPDWFDQQYQSATVPYDTSTNAKYSVKYDLEAVWADVKRLEAKGRDSTVWALKDAFGGYCDNSRAHGSSHLAFGPDDHIVGHDSVAAFESIRNPWRAGGCVPHAPVVALDPTGRATWETPVYDGGDGISAYVVEWRGGTEEFDPSRRAEVGPSVRSRDTPAGAPGSVVRVTARNGNGAGESGEATRATVAPGPPRSLVIAATEGTLSLTWEAPASDGGAEITRYDVRSILTATLNDGDDTNDMWTEEVLSAWTAGDLSYSITGLTGQEYTVQVRAANSVGPGMWSARRAGTPASDDSTLSALSLSEGRLDPGFAVGADTDTYTAAVANTVNQITVTATPNHAGARAVLLGPAVDADSGAAGYQVNLNVGENTVIIRVTAANGDARTYTVTVTRVGRDTGLTPPTNNPAAPFPSDAVYTVTFSSAWTIAVTPDGLPSGAHFTRLAGAVHNADVTFLESGQTASAGVELMAEDGDNETLEREVQAAIDDATALSFLEATGAAVPQRLDPTTLRTTHPRVTLVSMIAPSPDWFVGVSGLSLLNSSGRWLRSHSVNLYPWDAGTEEGTDFSLTNEATDPQGLITSIRGKGKFSTEPIAMLSFALQSVATTREVAENTGRNTNIGLPVRPTATSGTVSYALDNGTDAESFTLNTSNGQLRTQAALNYEEEQRYELEVTATDEAGSTTTTVTISVTDVDEPPAIGGRAHVSIAENSTRRVGSYNAVDPEGEPTIWGDLTGGDSDHFELDNGVLRFDELPDFEARADKTYEVTLRASDGTQFGTLDVVVTVTPVNERPVVTGSASYDVPEQSSGRLGRYTAMDPDGQDVRWTLSGDDAPRFTHVNGVVSWKAEPDFENPADHDGDNRYEFSVEATDGDLTGSQLVTVSVSNLPETGSFSLSSDQPRIKVPYVATLEDPDIVKSEVWTWERREGGSSSVWERINGATTGTYTPTGEDRHHFLRVTVDYRDGAMAENDPDLRFQARSEYAVVPHAGSNTPPTFQGAVERREVREDANPGTAIGARVTAHDTEGDPLNYTLSGAPPLDIDNQGQIRVGTGLETLDYESAPSYSVTVTATDSFGASGSTTFEILVVDVNEAPLPLPDNVVTLEDMPVTINVLDNDDDPDSGDGPTLTVATALRMGPSHGSATVDPATNEITYMPSLNYNGVDSFEYRVQDNRDLEADATVEVTITAVNDAPEFRLTAPLTYSISANARPGENVARVTAFDVEEHSVTYGLSGSPNFGIEEHTGQITVAPGAMLDATEYTVTVTATDSGTPEARATIAVTITVTAGPSAPSGGGGVGVGGGGGGASGPSPSAVDFEWTVKHDIEALAAANDSPTGAWSDGATLWLLEAVAGDARVEGGGRGVNAVVQGVPPTACALGRGSAMGAAMLRSISLGMIPEQVYSGAQETLLWIQREAAGTRRADRVAAPERVEMRGRGGRGSLRGGCGTEAEH